MLCEIFIDAHFIIVNSSVITVTLSRFACQTFQHTQKHNWVNVTIAIFTFTGVQR